MSGKNPRPPLCIRDKEDQSGWSECRTLWLRVFKPGARVPDLRLCTDLLPEGH